MFVLGGGGHGTRQDHVGGEICCRRGSIYEAFNQLPWQNIGALGTNGTIAEDPVHDEPEVWGWYLPDRVLVGAAALKCPAASERQCLGMRWMGQRPSVLLGRKHLDNAQHPLQRVCATQNVASWVLDAQ